MRRRRRSIAIVGALLIAVLVGGCKDAPSVSTVRWQLEQQIPGAEFEKDFHIRLGRLSLGVVKGLAGWVIEDEAGKAMLKAVKRVDVGSYAVVSLPPLDEIEAPRGLASKLGDSGWSLLVREQSSEEHVWVFMRNDPQGAIRNVYVIALDDVELTMVSLEGRLDEVLVELIADDPAGFAYGLGG